jgi:hypothetical protein
MWEPQMEEGRRLSQSPPLFVLKLGLSAAPPSGTNLPIDSALVCYGTVRVPHPRNAFVFVARVGKHDVTFLGRINRGAYCHR